jgi:Protein of unknown function (DUF2817)
LDTKPVFSVDYKTARIRFREAAEAAGWELLKYPIVSHGPDGEELTIDVAIEPGGSTDRALIISSGVHGVEGFFGSAVQLSLLREWGQRTDPRAVRFVFLHGLCPFGFAWRRRVNEDNVDINRNLLLDGERFQGSPKGYAELDKLLNPKTPPSQWEPVTLKLLLAIARHGMPALKQAVASGQYDFPNGLFFGGDRPSRTSEVLAAHFDRWLGHSRLVMHLDFHTGLGAWATPKLLIDYPLTETHRHRFRRWLGPNAFESTDPNMTAYTARGSFGQWCLSRANGRDYMYAAAEFGTSKPIQVLAGLRAENQAHHWGQREDPSTERAKQRLVELFCPRAETWRSQVLEKSHRLVKQAIDGLVGEP